ncbi:MAG: AI-2E family transporter [Candidatus Limnocylindrales bacterium]
MDIKLTRTERRAVGVVLVGGAALIATALLVLAYQFVQAFFGLLFLFFMAWLLSFVISPFAARLGARFPKVAGGIAATLVFGVAAMILIAALVVIGASAVGAADQLLDGSSSPQDAVAHVLQPFEGLLTGFGLNTRSVAASVVTAINSTVSGQAQALAATGVTVLGQAMTIVFIAVLIYAGRDSYATAVLRLVPPSRHDLVVRFEAAAYRSFSGFIRGQLGVGLVFGIVAAVVSLVVGLPLNFVPLIAFLAGLLQTIPFFGQIVSWAPPVLVALLFKPDALVPSLVLIGVGAILFQQLIQPRIVSRAIGLDPILVLAAVFGGAQLFGAAGAIFGVPVLAVFTSMLRAWLDENRPVPVVEPAAIDAIPDEPVVEQPLDTPIARAASIIAEVSADDAVAAAVEAEESAEEAAESATSAKGAAMEAKASAKDAKASADVAKERLNPE